MEKEPSFLKHQLILKQIIEETDKKILTPVMTNEESEEVCFEFQVSTGTSAEKEKLSS